METGTAVKRHLMKMISIVLTVLTLAGLFCGCVKKSSSAPATAPEEISVWDAEPAQQEERWNELMAELDYDAGEAQAFLDGLEDGLFEDTQRLDRLTELIEHAETLDHAVPDEEAYQDRAQEAQMLLNELMDTTWELQESAQAIRDRKEEEALWTTASYDFVQDDGYQYEVTVKYSQLIPVENWDAIQETWDKIGNGNALPEMSDWGFEHYEGGIWRAEFGTTAYEPPGDYVYTRANSMYYLMGTVVFENKTEGWPLSETNRGTPMMYICDTGNGWTNYAVGRIYYSSTYELFDSNILFRPSMTKDKTGEIPFVIGLVEYYAPDYPNGAYRDLYGAEDFLKISIPGAGQFAMPTTFYES